MDDTLRRKWVEALRSGEYKQGSGFLYMQPENEYCCLGVLCKIQGAEWKDWTNDKDKDDMDYEEYTHVPVINDQLLSLYGEELLNDIFLQDLGMSEQLMQTLVAMNDGRESYNDELEKVITHPRKSFAEIADFIESEEFEKLNDQSD